MLFPQHPELNVALLRPSITFERDVPTLSPKLQIVEGRPTLSGADVGQHTVTSVHLIFWQKQLVSL